MSAAAAYERARQAQPAWAARPLADRLAILKRFGELVDERRDELAAVLSAETGKPITQARNELAGVIPRIEFFLDETEHVLATETVLADDGAALHEQISFDPLGVVANISAWNYPWFVGINVVAPALLAGNARALQALGAGERDRAIDRANAPRRRRAGRRVHRGRGGR